MFIRQLVSAAIATAAAAIPLYLLTRPDASASQITYPALLATTFIASLFATALVLYRFPARAGKNRPSRAPRKRTAADDGARESGHVKWFNTAKGYGFITRDSGDDVFVHFRAIRGSGHRSLKEGQRVEFSVSRAEKGLQADDVTDA